MDNNGLEFLPIPNGGVEVGGGAKNLHYEMFPYLISLLRPNLILFSPSLGVDLSHHRIPMMPWKTNINFPLILSFLSRHGKWNHPSPKFPPSADEFRKVAFSIWGPLNSRPLSLGRSSQFENLLIPFSGPLTSRLSWRSYQFDPITIQTPILINYSKSASDLDFDPLIQNNTVYLLFPLRFQSFNTI